MCCAMLFEPFAKPPKAWPHSSFGRDVKAGVYPLDWGRERMCDEGGGSE